jgi:hypothetical protein
MQSSKMAGSALVKSTHTLDCRHRIFTQSVSRFEASKGERLADWVRHK